MVNYLAEKYASLVNADMVKTLFEKLAILLGDNRTKAADECGLTRKAIYDWDNLKEEIKLSTKEKVLEQSLEQMPIETLDYLTKQMHDSSSDVLMSYLSSIYERVYDTKKESDFLQVTGKFEDATRTYAGLIYKKLDYEVDDMMKELSLFAKSQNIKWMPHPVHLYDSNDLKKIIPQIVNSWIYYGLPQTPEELASRLKIPKDVVDIVGETLNREFYPLPDPQQRDKTSSGIEIGYYVAGNEKTMLSAAATLKYKTNTGQELIASGV